MDETPPTTRGDAFAHVVVYGGRCGISEAMHSTWMEAGQKKRQKTEVHFEKRYPTLGGHTVPIGHLFVDG